MQTPLLLVSRKISVSILRSASLAALLLLLGNQFATALEVAGLFTDHMVLQREVPVPVWGWAEPGEMVTVKIDDQTKTAIAGADGKWMLRLDAMKIGAPRTMTVSGKTESLKFDDVLLGEVWIASGQSNMEWYLSQTKDAEAAIASANLLEVRLLNIAHSNDDIRAKGEPADRLPRYKPEAKQPPFAWKPCTPDEARDRFSGVAFHFARELYAKLKVPIGIIPNPVGGTAIEQWISRSAFEADADLKAVPQFYDRLNSFAQTDAGKAELAKASAEYEQEQAKLKSEGKPLKWPTHFAPVLERDSFNSVWFNTRVNPLIPYAIRGVIWYQGEGNTYRKDWPDYSSDYQDLFPLLIRDWRAHWGQGDFPFLFVQLPVWAKPNDEPTSGDGGWATIREGQLLALKEPRTGMAVTLDVGDPNNMHPANKEPVGQRLALAARQVAYGEKIESSGPIFREMKLEGGKARLLFDHIGSGLEYDGMPLKRFSIAGADRKFVWADAVIDGDTVVVSSAAIQQPTAVRYAWETNPEGANLRNKEGLLASPFRTDPPARKRGSSYKGKLAEPPHVRSNQ